MPIEKPSTDVDLRSGILWSESHALTHESHTGLSGDSEIVEFITVFSACQLISNSCYGYYRITIVS